MMQIAGYHQKYNVESLARKEQLFQKQLKNMISNFGSWEEYLHQMSIALQPLIPFDLMISLYINDENCNSQLFGVLRIGFDEYQKITSEGFQELTELKRHELQAILENTISENEISIYIKANLFRRK